MHHLFLQSVRVPMRFENFFPASILILETEEPKGDPTRAWDFSDNPPTMSIGCRMGKVGIICALQDGGAQQQLHFPQLKKTLPPKLDPMQFREVRAKVRYMARLFNRIPKYFIMKGREGPYTVVQNPLQGYSSKPLFDPWEQAEYVKVLSAMTRISVEHLFHPPDLVWTWLMGTMPQFVAPDSNQLLAALHALENEKGRGAALMAAAWVDDSLRSWLEAYLARDSRIAKGLLGPDQPLGSFGVKIKVAYLLGLIDDEMRADADVIRSVRNDFAHFRSRISWSDRSVVDRCRRLQTAKAFDRLTLGRTRSPRQRF